MKNLNITVDNKVATYLQRDGEIVCGNSDYQIIFTFDADWDAYDTKTARFIWNGKHMDVPFAGNECQVPTIKNTDEVKVGVYAGDISTTTPATIPCKRSVLCGDEEMYEGNPEVCRDQAIEAAERAEAAAARAEAASGGGGGGGTITVDQTYNQNSANAQSGKAVAQALGKLSLGLHTDGLLYVFVDGEPVGDGIALESGAIGDVIGTLDENNNMILTGDLADGTYTLKYENADGTYTEIGSLVVAEAPEEPVYTNLAVPTDSSAQADWEAGNWCNESFIGGSSYGYRAAAGTSRVTTNTIAVENGDTIYVKGINFSTDVSTQTQVALFDADGARIYHAKIDNAVTAKYITELAGTEGEDYFSFKTCGTDGTDLGTRFIRLAGFLSGEATDVIITRNQPIV